jgi:hypothetical protein
VAVAAAVAFVCRRGRRRRRCRCRRLCRHIMFHNSMFSILTAFHLVL